MNQMEIQRSLQLCFIFPVLYFPPSFVPLLLRNAFCFSLLPPSFSFGPYIAYHMSIPAQSSETAAAEPYDYAAYAAWWHSVYGAPQIPQPQNETVTVNGQSQPAPPASFEQQKALYVGNLDTRVNEGLLSDVFSTAGMVSNVKIVVDRNVRNKHYAQQCRYNKHTSKS